MKQFSKLLLITIGMLLSHSSYALEFSVASSVMGERIKIGSEKFNPIVAEIELGVTHLESGFGLSAHLGQGVVGDDAVGIDMDVLQQNSLFLNYVTRYEDDYRVILSAGYSLFEIDSQNSAGFPGKQDYEATSFAISIQEPRFLNIQNLNLTGSYRHLYDDDDLTIQGLSLGVRYAF